MKKCEVCFGTNLEAVLNLEHHPLCDDLIPVGSNLENDVFHIEIAICKDCLTAHQLHQVDKERLFPLTYHYRSRFTSDVLAGMEELRNHITEKLGCLQGKLVLDVGCNDGSLLDFFAAKGAKTFGVEPTGAASDAVGRDHVIINGYFTNDLATNLSQSHGAMNIITFTNVFAHIENLGELLNAVQVLMDDETILVIENHYLGSVLASNQFDTFYHEHPRTYSLNSFKMIAKRLGVSILDVQFPKRYGGNIRVIMGQKHPGKYLERTEADEILKSEMTFCDQFGDMRTFIDRWKFDKRAQIDRLVALCGPLPAKAFPGRAAILIKMLNLSTDQISAVYEKPGSMKIGNYLPGTRIPIKSDEEIDYSKHKQVINLAWHIAPEIKTYLKSLGFKGDLVSIV